ncbi:unnamed protein product [Musa textilis]
MNENSSCELNSISILYPTSLVVNQTVLYPWPVEFPLSLGGELQLSRSFFFFSLIGGFWNRVNPICIKEVTPLFPKSQS